MSGYSDQITTLLLDSSFMPYSFLTGRATFLHLIKNSIKCFDAEENLIDNNLQWFSNQGVNFHNDQPFLTSKDKIWFLPTTAVIKSSFFSKRKKMPKTLNLQKLCLIFVVKFVMKNLINVILLLSIFFPALKAGRKK
jgi:hypothetical protein